MTGKRVLVILAGAAAIVALVVLGLQLAANFTPTSTDLGPGVEVQQPSPLPGRPDPAGTGGISPTVPVSPDHSATPPNPHPTGGGS